MSNYGDNFDNQQDNIKLSQHSINEVLTVVKLTSESINKSILSLQENTKDITLILQDIVKETNKMPFQATREEIKDYISEAITPELIKIKDIVNEINNEVKTVKKDHEKYSKDLARFVDTVDRVINNFDRKLYKFMTWTGVIFVVLSTLWGLLHLGMVHFGG